MDLVVKIPTERAGGRDQSYTVSYAEVTLIVELRDSESGEILARVADRRDPAESNLGEAPIREGSSSIGQT
jgi:hypothetical protein